MASFEGKVIAITGAASGMGLSTAQLLASRGALLSLADINLLALQSALSTIPSQQTSQGQPLKHMCTAVDVRSTASVDEWITATVARYGRLDGAVNMAGVIRPAAGVDETSDEDWDFVMNVNASGVFRCLRAEIAAMKTQRASNESSNPRNNEAEGRCSIVSASSTFGQIGAPGNIAYCASKAAVIAMTRTAAKENPLIRVNCVAPGSVNTPLSASEDPEHVRRGLKVTAQKRRAEPAEVAKVIAFLLSDEASFVTGAVYNVDGGWVC